MRVFDPATGQTRFEKRRHRYNEANQPRELTFSCYQRIPFFSRDPGGTSLRYSAGRAEPPAIWLGERTCEWFIQSLEAARQKYGFELWAFVLMPDHVHLLVNPLDAADDMSKFLQAIKESVARKAIAYLKANSPDWLARITVQEGQRIRHRFWQPGGGYDRNITSSETLRAMIEYIHANPIRRGLVTRIEDYEYSSARWYAGTHPVKIEMDDQVLVELSRC